MTDPSELADVPDGTAILDALGVLRQLTGDGWAGTSSGALPSPQVPLPATVLHVP
jgi:hypothetical protein